MKKPDLQGTRKTQSPSKRFGKGGWIVFAIVLGLGTWILTTRQSGPSYQGKHIEAWFEDAVQNSNNIDSPSVRAFREMEGDAVPFLVRQMNARPTAFDKAYITMFGRMPRSLVKSMPKPRDDGYYSQRHATALELLKWIGREQRFKAEAGEPSSKPSIALAVPSIQAALNDDAISAASTLWSIGPPAAPAVPELIRVAQGTNSIAAIMAIQSFRLIGPAASNAMPVLISVVTNVDHKDRVHAAYSLGGMGNAASAAVPVLASLLIETNKQSRIAGARCIAEIGTTPEASVALLEAMRQSTNELAAAVATMALWNRDPQNKEYSEELIAHLDSENKGPLLSMLWMLGTNALPFVQAIEPLVNDPDPDVSRFAKRALREISSATP